MKLPGKARDSCWEDRKELRVLHSHTPHKSMSSILSTEQWGGKEENCKGGKEKYSIFMEAFSGVDLKQPKEAKDEEQEASV